jgi:uncharacterized protein (DUF433 family)
LFINDIFVILRRNYFVVMTVFNEIIRIHPEKRFGKPCVRDTRITVYDVLGWLSAGMSYDEIIADFPELTRQDILACLAFAAQRERTPSTG